MVVYLCQEYYKMDSIDNYQVLNLIGKGGFASVFKAK